MTDVFMRRSLTFEDTGDLRKTRPKYSGPAPLFACADVGVEGREDSFRTVRYLHYPNLGVPHGTSTRIGGISGGEYEGLNIGQTTKDLPRRVHENRLRLGAALGFPLVTVLNMVHGDHTVILDEPVRALRIGDACATACANVPMMITTADCVPVLFHDPVKNAVCLAHAGWRGTVANIVGSAVKAMRDNFGSQPADIQAAVGPSIGPCCFEVGDEVVEQFLTAFPGQDIIQPYRKKHTIDLWEANYLLLLEAGIAPENICVSCICTACHSELFYSYRRDRGVTGRMASAIMLP
ncbi:MAG: peptidoglycan editing factor PgeF [bacterium]|nr:peptidoglycan editing factor PgeF [bacterium]